MEFTGERFVPALKGQIYYEHLHRYALVSPLVAMKRVLDVACGEGYGAALLSRSAAEVIGVDLDEQSIEHARRAYYSSNLRFQVGSITEIPLPDACVDVIASFETIEHVAEHDRMLDELRRVLAPGGVVVLSSPNKLVYSDTPGFNNPFHVQELYFSEFRDLLTRRFRHVALYGQRVSASSVVHPLAGDVSAPATWYNGNVERITTGLPTLSNPAYFIAVCSDEQLSVDVSSGYIDAADDLLEDIWIELATLRSRQSIATLEHSDQNIAPPRGDLPETASSQAGERRDEEPDARDVRIGDLEAEVAALRAQHLDELADVRTKYERQVDELATGQEQERERVRTQHELQLAQLRESLAAETANLAQTYERRETALKQQAAAEYERSCRMHQELTDVREELRRTHQAAVAADVELRHESARSKQLLQQLAELRTEPTLGAAVSLAAAERARADARKAAALLREEVLRLSEALQRADEERGFLREVLASRSWKLTAPLRRAAALVRR